tara:strand:- start:10474 stop:10680 length:207 start_codon:yes stop_codon:yes gene_type:complete
MSKPFIDGHKYLVTGELLNKNYELIRDLLDMREPYHTKRRQRGTDDIRIELAVNVVRIEDEAQRILEP